MTFSIDFQSRHSSYSGPHRDSSLRENEVHLLLPNLLQKISPPGEVTLVEYASNSGSGPTMLKYYTNEMANDFLRIKFPSTVKNDHLRLGDPGFDSINTVLGSSRVKIILDRNEKFIRKCGLNHVQRFLSNGQMPT